MKVKIDGLGEIPVTDVIVDYPMDGIGGVWNIQPEHKINDRIVRPKNFIRYIEDLERIVHDLTEENGEITYRVEIQCFVIDTWGRSREESRVFTTGLLSEAMAKVEYYKNLDSVYKQISYRIYAETRRCILSSSPSPSSNLPSA